MAEHTRGLAWIEQFLQLHPEVGAQYLLSEYPPVFLAAHKLFPSIQTLISNSMFFMGLIPNIFQTS